VLPLALLFSVAAFAQSPALYTYQVVHTYPHDRAAFTQGLIYIDGFLWEGTGQNGQSAVRKVKLETGQVLEHRPIANQFFGEGITNWGRTLVQLTWQSGLGFVYDRASLEIKQQFRYQGEGWGITQDGKRFIMSDGTAYLRVWEPSTFREIGRIPVTDRGRLVEHLNELEFIKGEIYANIWQSDRIARISPETGRVLGWIDMTGLLTAAERAGTDVLNGIAYDAPRDRLFVTGKLWPRLFHIRLIKKQ
jgi:glutamine cyclotransferase